PGMRWRSRTSRVAVMPSPRSSTDGSSGALRSNALIELPPELTAPQIAPADVPQISLPSLARTLPLIPGRTITRSWNGMDASGPIRSSAAPVKSEFGFYGLLLRLRRLNIVAAPPNTPQPRWARRTGGADQSSNTAENATRLKPGGEASPGGATRGRAAV